MSCFIVFSGGSFVIHSHFSRGALNFEFLKTIFNILCLFLAFQTFIGCDTELF